MKSNNTVSAWLICLCWDAGGWMELPHGRQVPCDDIQGLDRVFWDLVQMTWQGLQQHLQTDHRHPLQGHLERLILPLPRQGHLQIHLEMERERQQTENRECGKGRKGARWTKDKVVQEEGDGQGATPKTLWWINLQKMRQRSNISSVATCVNKQWTHSLKCYMDCFCWMCIFFLNKEA